MLTIESSFVNFFGEIQSGFIHIQNGLISSIEEKSEPKKSGDFFSAKDFLVLPGMVDAHTHFREPGEVFKEGIINGSRAALAGGVTTVLDMPNNRPPCTTLKRLKAKKDIFSKKCLVNWGLHLQATPRHSSQKKEPAASVKIYMAKSSILSPIFSEEGLQAIFKRFPRVTIHAEDSSRFFISSKGSPQPFHHELRPKEAIISALGKIESAYESIPAKKRPRLVICHVSTMEEVSWLRKVKGQDWDIWGETSPHYLFFTKKDYIIRGNAFKVNPPLRSENDRDAIFEAVKDGVIDFVSSDHAPHLPNEKTLSENAPSGIASLEWFGGVLLSLVDQGLINWKRFLEISCKNSAKCFGIPLRDGIKPGNFADLLFISQKGKFSPGSNIITNARFNPYENFDFTRRIQRVLVNGEWAYIKGEALIAPVGREVYA